MLTKKITQQAKKGASCTEDSQGNPENVASAKKRFYFWLPCLFLDPHSANSFGKPPPPRKGYISNGMWNAPQHGARLGVRFACYINLAHVLPAQLETGSSAPRSCTGLKNAILLHWGEKESFRVFWPTLSTHTYGITSPVPNKPVPLVPTPDLKPEDMNGMKSGTESSVSFWRMERLLWRDHVIRTSL